MTSPTYPLSVKDKLISATQAAARLPQVELEDCTSHIFNGGIYARTLFRKAGTLIFGKTHKKDHIYVVLQGTVAIVTDGPPVQYIGPCVLAFPAGTRRAVYALTDATCSLIVRTDRKALDDDLERELVEEEPGARYDIYNRIIEPRLIKLGEISCR